MRRLVLATTNNGKVAELRELLKDLPYEVVGLPAYPGAPEVEETGATFAENAVLKAKAMAEYTGELTLADDSGLEVDALNGAPGVFSARYGQPGWNDRQRYEYLLAKLAGTPLPDRTARFRCAVALYDPASGRLEQADGAVEGLILEAPRGSNGFGYDPLFLVPELDLSMAELSPDRKNELSHRARAIQQILPVLERMAG
jgi:XTP/dITP diphosphohydrolase